MRKELRNSGACPYKGRLNTYRFPSGLEPGILARA
jgi:hypothetical protein